MQSYHDNHLSDLLLHELAEHLYPDDYRRLGLRLSFENARLEHIERARCGNLHESIYQVLVEWKKREGRSATSHALAHSLKLIGNKAAADWLQGEVDSCISAVPDEGIEFILTRGNVPSLPECLTDRPDELDEIRQKLRALSNSTTSAMSPAASRRCRWLVIHGMGGMGKSVLANQAIRDEELVKECFPDGVFWVSIGAVVKGKAEITERLETLCRILDDGLLMAPSPPKTKDQWKHLLSTLIMQQYPRSLLVLDDVWEEDVIRAFEVRCTVVMTTRDASLHSCISGRKDQMIISQGFSTSQSLQAISTWTGLPTSDLPPEAERIHQLTGGSPLAVSIIGGLLKDFGDRWAYYVTQLEEGDLGRLSAVREAIDLSVRELPSRDAIMKVFSWFAVFDQGTVLSSKILGMLEGCSTEEIEDRMKVLAQRHLVISRCGTEDRCQNYWLHDLVYDYLMSVDAAKDKDPQICNDFKSLMVFNRFKMCRRDMIQTGLCLPQSSPVFQRARKACEVGPTASSFLITEIADRRPPVYSITHRPAGMYATCAKLLSNGKEVVTAGYGGQVQIANVVDGKARTLINRHAENVTDLSLSPDGALMATCSPAKGVCVWDFSRTDRQLPLVKNVTHDGGAEVVKCSFVQCDGETLLVSGDHSGYLKIWSSSFTVLHSLRAHKNEITSCSTCEREAAVVTSAKYAFNVKVVCVRDGSEKLSIPHDHYVLDCLYLSNGLIVTLTWCLLQVFTSRGRLLCQWAGREDTINFQNLSCAETSKGYFIAVRGIAGVSTVLKLSKLFQVTRKLSTYFRLNVGGVYRDVLNTWLVGINGNREESGLYLVTSQRCGLILVWKLAREESRTEIIGDVFDVSFKTDGRVKGVVGIKPKSSRTCLIVHPCSQTSFFKSATPVYKTKKFESIIDIKINQDRQGQVVFHTNERIKVSFWSHCLGNRSKTNGPLKKKQQEFNIVTSQDNVLLAHVIGADVQYLLTVSTGNGVSLETWLSDGSVADSHSVDFRQGLSADLSRDYTRVAVGCSSGVVLLYSITDFKINEGGPSVLEVDDFRVTHCVFSTDGQLLAVAANRKVAIFDVKSLTRIADFVCKSKVSAIRFTPDNELLLIVTGGLLSLHESRTLCRRGQCTAYAAAVTDFHFSADGKFLVTAGALRFFDKGYLEWWRIDQSGCISQLQKFAINSRIKRVVCNQYFTVFVTADEVGEIYVLERITAEGK